MRMHIRPVLPSFCLGLLGLVLLTGCGTKAREEVFESEGPTTREIWYGHSFPSPLLADQVGFNTGGPDGVSAWTRTTRNELSVLFPTLPNPRIPLYVYPHLTERGDPVPGYVTVFHLYDSGPHYALPGEAFREGLWP